MRSPLLANHLRCIYVQKVNRVNSLSIITNQKSRLLEEVRKDSLGWLFKSESVDKAGILREESDIIPLNGKYRLATYTSRTSQERQSTFNSNNEKPPLKLTRILNISIWDYLNTGACSESVVNATHPYPWKSGTEFGYLISIMVPLNHHPATPGVCNSERSNRNKSSTAKRNSLSTQHKDGVQRIPLWFCVCGGDGESGNPVLTPVTREGGNSDGSRGKGERARAVPYQLHELWGNAP